MLRSRQASPLVFAFPWSGLFSRSRNRAYPWACMSCGVVLFYLENLPALSAEFRERQAQVAKASAAPLKP
jgi:hypothetical protein